MAAAAVQLDVRTVSDDIPVLEAREIEVLAFEAWRRGSSRALIFQEQWIGEEERVLMPH